MISRARENRARSQHNLPRYMYPPVVSYYNIRPCYILVYHGISSYIMILDGISVYHTHSPSSRSAVEVGAGEGELPR